MRFRVNCIYIFSVYRAYEKKSTLNIEQLLNEVEQDMRNYEDRGLCYLSKPVVEADNTKSQTETLIIPHICKDQIH